MKEIKPTSSMLDDIISMLEDIISSSFGIYVDEMEVVDIKALAHRLLEYVELKESEM